MTSDRENDMPNPMENMLAVWPVLYSEMIGAGEQSDKGEAARVREEVVRPLLDSDDLLHTFEGM